MRTRSLLEVSYLFMKPRIFLLLFVLMAALQTTQAAESLAGKGVLELFVNGKRVAADAKLYQLFSNFVLSSTITQRLDDVDARAEIADMQRCHTRLVFTASQPFTVALPYGDRLDCKKIYVTLPENHIPQVLIQGIKKSSDLSSYSYKALKALASHPAINKGNLIQYQPPKKEAQPKTET